MSSNKPSVVESLSQVHAVLLKDLKKLTDAAQAPSAISAEAWHKQLEPLRKRLAEHFYWEEQDGYMSAVLKREPHQERVVQHLLADHRQLMKSLNALLEQTARGADVDEAFRHQVREWVEALRAHEHRENSLVEDVFSLDTGTKD